MCFTRKLPENGKKERLGLTRAGSCHDQEILAINKAVTNRIRLMLVRRIVEQCGEFVHSRGEGSEDFKRSGRQSFDRGKTLTALIARCRFDIGNLINDSRTVEQFLPLLDEGRVTDMIGRLDVVP